MKSRHTVFAEDSAVISVVVPKLIKSRINSLGNFSGRVRKYIIDGLLREEMRMAKAERRKNVIS
jgi:hypothetical protein